MKELIYSSKLDEREVLVYTPECEGEFSRQKLEAAIHVFAYRTPLNIRERKKPTLIKATKYGS